MPAFIKKCDPYHQLMSVHGHGQIPFRRSSWADFAMYQQWDESGGYRFMLENRRKQAQTGRPMPQVNEEYGYEDHRTSSAKPKWLDMAAKRGIDFPRRDYAAVLKHMDYSAGRLLETLDELEIEKNTLVIYLSDNGAITMENPTNVAYPGNNGPLRGGKGTVYEGGIRVPCVMRWKGRLPEGIVSTETAIHADIFATCLDATGLSVPQTNGASPVRRYSGVVFYYRADGD